jgi:hypothetical protein
VDAGDLYWRSAAIQPQEIPQAQEKARLQAAVYAKNGVDAMLPGEGDLALGFDFVKGLADTHALPYVAANLECGGTRPFPAVRAVERGGVSIVAVGIVPSDLQAQGCVATEAGAALEGALAGVKADVVVLLIGEDPAVTDRLLKTHPEVDFVLSPDNKQLDAAEVLTSGALRIGAGSRGRQLGALGFTLVAGAEGWRDEGALGDLAEKRDSSEKRLKEAKARAQNAPTEEDRRRAQTQVDFYQKQLDGLSAKLSAASDHQQPSNLARNQLIALGTEVPDDPDVKAMVEAAKDRINALAPSAPAEVRYEGPFIGSTKCLACHPAEAAQWRGTAHAHAWTTLVTEKRQLDQACWSCHVTGAVHPDGPKFPGEAVAAHLESVGCEACHGPGRDHQNQPAQFGMSTPTEATCTKCHDGVKDEGRFDYATYLPKVKHK